MQIQNWGFSIRNVYIVLCLQKWTMSVFPYKQDKVNIPVWKSTQIYKVFFD